MPRVRDIPVITDPSVALRPLAAPQLPGASPADFGAGLGQALRAGAGALQQVAIEQINRRNAAAVQGTDADLALWEDSNVENGESGALARRGEQARGVATTTLQEFDAEVGRVRSGLESESQRLAFDSLAARRREAIASRLRNHEMREADRTDQEKTAAAVAASTTFAGNNATDPERVQLELARIEGAIRSRGQRTGEAKEVTTQKVAEATTAAHLAVINRLLAPDVSEPEMARAYYDKVKAMLTGVNHETLAENVQQGDLRKKTQEEATRILGTHSTDLTAALEAARKITDPALQERVVAEVKLRFSEQDQARRVTESRSFDRASDRLEATKRLDSIDPADWTGMSSAGKASLETRARQLAEGIEPTTDWRKWTDFTQMAPRAILELNPMRDLRPYLDDGKYAQAVAVIAELRANNGNPSISYTTIRTDREMLESAARASGIIPKSGAQLDAAKWSEHQRDSFDRFSRSAQDKITQFEASVGRPATPTERQQQVDSVLLETYLVPQGIFGQVFKSVPRPLLTVDDIGKARMPFDQIDSRVGAGTVQEIRNHILSLRARPTPEMIERVAALMALMPTATPEEKNAAILAIVKE